MFPRGYFKRVTAYVTWTLLIILAIWGFLQMFRTNKPWNDDSAVWEWMERQLWKCDCPDHSSHVDPELHTSTCTYYLWYENEGIQGE